jgi:hypothetical protein
MSSFIFQSEGLACAAAFRSALVAHGLQGSLFESCGLSSFLGLYAVRCRNYTTVPSTFSERVEAACAPGLCNGAEDCTTAAMEVSGALAGPRADELTFIVCGSFLVLSEWSKYGAAGYVQRMNCYWDLPEDLHFHVSASDGAKWNLLVKLLISGSVLLVAGLAVVGFLCLFAKHQIRRTSKDRDNFKFMTSKLSKEQLKGPLRWYTLTELRNATQSFSERLILGKGGSGCVFWGKLEDGTEVAVKKMPKPSTMLGYEVRH